MRAVYYHMKIVFILMYLYCVAMFSVRVFPTLFDHVHTISVF